jgi:hypothetical protein
MYVTVAPTLVAGAGLALTGGAMLWLVPIATVFVLLGLVLTRHSAVSRLRDLHNIQPL